MCTYNGSKYISQQLNSILNQSRKVDEIVICDDHSTDDTIAIIEEILSNDFENYQIHVNDNNIGYIKNFDKAIGLCSGDLIFLCDQDDIWENKRVEEYVNIFSKSDCDVIVGNASLINSEGSSLDNNIWKKSSFTLDSWNRGRIITKNYFPGSTLAITKKIYRDITPFPVEFIHDHWIMLRAFLMYKICFLEKELTKYRIHNGQSIGLGDKRIKKKKAKIKFDIRKKNYLTHIINSQNKLISLFETIEITNLKNEKSKAIKSFHDNLEYENKLYKKIMSSYLIKNFIIISVISMRRFFQNQFSKKDVIVHFFISIKFFVLPPSVAKILNL